MKKLNNGINEAKIHYYGLKAKLYNVLFQALAFVIKMQLRARTYLLTKNYGSK